MVIINLREQYPFYSEDCFVEVSDEVAQEMQLLDRREESSRRKLYYHKAYFSLDRNDGIELNALIVSCSPNEIYDYKVMCELLHAAIAKLPDKQGKRIYAHYFLGMSVTAIARAEGVTRGVISIGIKRGLRNMERILKCKIF